MFWGVLTRSAPCVSEGGSCFQTERGSCCPFCVQQLITLNGRRILRGTKQNHWRRAHYERLSGGGVRADLTTMMARPNALQCVLEDWLRQVSLVYTS